MKILAVIIVYTVSLMALCTFSVAVYAISQGIWMFLPIHIFLFFTQIAIIVFNVVILRESK